MRMITYFEAYLDDYKIVNIYRRKNTLNNRAVFFYIEDKNNNQIALRIINTSDDAEYVRYECEVQGEIAFGIEYEVYHEQGRKTPLVFAMVVKSAAFDAQFYYQGPLGAIYAPAFTEFYVWAPTAYDVKLELHSGIVQTYEMKRYDNGVFKVRVDGNLHGACYMYLISVNGQMYRSLDPYAKAVDLNTNFNVVVDTPKAVESTKGLPIMESACDAILYEISIRDITAEKTFKGFIEAQHNTGLSYVKSLGITHIQVMPIATFGGVDVNRIQEMYNWGYDVIQWMAIENSYGSNIHVPDQSIQDFKEFVYVCHQNGIRVNVDVVFNHVFNENTSCLHTTVPYYYFQIAKDYTYSNGTMCGNDIDSSRKMCSRIIQDTCMYLLETFDIDGLRFDLMGILDVDTMLQIDQKTRAKKPGFMLYGEGWNMLSALDETKRATIQNNDKLPNVAFFSDVFRDTIKGKQVRNYLERGYAMGNTSLLYLTMNVLSASVGDFGYHRIFQYPTQVVNYVECHDNMTSWDQIDVSINKSMDDNIKHHKLMLAFVLLAQGIPFIHSGQEFARTKYHHDNTYNMGDEINHFDYNRRDRYMDIVNYFKELVNIRKKYHLFKMDTTEEIYEKVYYEPIDQKALGYLLHNDVEEIYVIFNPTEDTLYKEFGNEWELLFLNGKSDVAEVRNIKIEPLDVIILHRMY